MAIPTRTVRAMLSTVREAAFAEDLPATVVAGLHRVVGADFITYDDFGPDGTSGVADPVPPPGLMEAWARFGHQHPSLPLCRNNPRPDVVRLSDIATQRQVRRLDLWDHLWRPLGIRHQLNVPLYEADRRLVGLGLNRTGRDFSDRDVEVMELVRVELAEIVARRAAVELDPLASAGLSEREREILDWLTTGMRDSEIASQLGLSTRTVSKHLESIYRKLGVSTRSAAAAIASTSGRRRLR